VRARGNDVYCRGRVVVEQADPNAIRATVHGTDRYQTVIEIAGRRLSGHCTCPYLAREADPCKHLWAVLLAAEDSGALAQASPRGPLVLKVTETDELDDEGEEGEWPELEDERGPSAASAKAAAGSAALTWREALNRLTVGAQPHSPQPETELVYFIEPGRQTSSAELVVSVLERVAGRNGQPSSLYPALFAHSKLATLADPVDQLMLLLAAAASAGVCRLLRSTARGRCCDTRAPLRIAQRRLPHLVERLVQEGWQVQAEGRVYRKPGEFALEISSGIDWFDVKGQLDFGPVVLPLPALLRAVRRRARFVPLGDGSLGMLPEEWLERWGLLAGAPARGKDHVRLSRAQAVLLEPLLSELVGSTWDADFEALRREIRGFSELAA
jgi:hypothetical protein